MKDRAAPLRLAPGLVPCGTVYCNPGKKNDSRIFLNQLARSAHRYVYTVRPLWLCVCLCLWLRPAKSPAIRFTSSPRRQSAPDVGAPRSSARMPSSGVRLGRAGLHARGSKIFPLTQSFSKFSRLRACLVTDIRHVLAHDDAMLATSTVHVHVHVPRGDLKLMNDDRADAATARPARVMLLRRGRRPHAARKHDAGGVHIGRAR